MFQNDIDQNREDNDILSFFYKISIYHLIFNRKLKLQIIKNDYLIQNPNHDDQGRRQKLNLITIIKERRFIHSSKKDNKVYILYIIL